MRSFSPSHASYTQVCLSKVLWSFYLILCWASSKDSVYGLYPSLIWASGVEAFVVDCWSSSGKTFSPQVLATVPVKTTYTATQAITHKRKEEVGASTVPARGNTSAVGTKKEVAPYDIISSPISILHPLSRGGGMMWLSLHYPEERCLNRSLLLTGAIHWPFEEDKGMKTTTPRVLIFRRLSPSSTSLRHGKASSLALFIITEKGEASGVFT